MGNPQPDLAARTDALLKAAGVTRQLFCSLVGISRATYYNYRSGERGQQFGKHVYYIRTVLAICALLNSGQLPVHIQNKRLKEQTQKSLILSKVNAL